LARERTRLISSNQKEAFMNAIVPAQENRPASKVDAFIADVLPPSEAQGIFSALPAHVRPERFRRNLANALMQQPNLMKCHPRMVTREVAKIAALGLLLDPQLGEAYLIPGKTRSGNYEYEPQARVGYRGLIKLARQSGEVATVYARDVCENDRFHVVEGTQRSIVHEPDYRSDRGAPKAYYAVFTLRDGTADFEVMSIGEIHRIRDRSDAYRAFKAGKIKSTPWGTDEGEMSKKTVLRRLSKRMPMSPDLAELLGREDEFDQRDARDVTPVQIVRNPLDDEPPPAIEHHEEDATPAHDDDGVVEVETASDDAPEPQDEPSDEDPSIIAARTKGEMAGAQGRPKKAPNEYGPAEADAWIEGWEAGRVPEEGPGQ
jgi:recombination protein RecT